MSDDRTRRPAETFRDLLVRYATGIDRRDWPLFRTVFTDDCELDYGEIGAWNGVDAVTEFMEQVHAMAGHTMHRLTNQAITVDGDTATARTYVDALIMFGDNKSGVNADRLLRRRDRPHRRRMAHRAPPVHPGAGEYGRRGVRGP